MQCSPGVFCFVFSIVSFSTRTRMSSDEEQPLWVLWAAESPGASLHNYKARLRSSKEHIVEGHSFSHGWLVSSSLCGLVPQDNSLIRLWQKVVIDSTQQRSLDRRLQILSIQTSPTFFNTEPSSVPRVPRTSQTTTPLFSMGCSKTLDSTLAWLYPLLLMNFV